MISRGDFIFGIVVVFLMGMLIGWIGTSLMGIDISQKAADEICVNLTGIEGTFADDGESLISGPLYCKTPTWDKTSNIIIQTNSKD